MESKALWKSNDNSIPGIFCTLVYSITSDISLMFSPIYLPSTKPVWSGWISLVSTDSRRLAIAFVAILRSTFSSVIGLQFPNSSKEPSSLGINVITPLRCETVSSLIAWASLKLAIRSFPNFLLLFMFPTVFLKTYGKCCWRFRPK